MTVCATCDRSVEKLRDEVSTKEAAVSGLCQGCQDDYFGPEIEKNASNQSGGSFDKAAAAEIRHPMVNGSEGGYGLADWSGDDHKECKWCGEPEGAHDLDDGYCPIPCKHCGQLLNDGHEWDGSGFEDDGNCPGFEPKYTVGDVTKYLGPPKTSSTEETLPQWIAEANEKQGEVT